MPYLKPEQLQKKQQKRHHRPKLSTVDPTSVTLSVLSLGKFYLFFRVAPPGCGGRRIKRLVILVVPGYIAGLPRFVPVSPGHDQPLYPWEIFISHRKPQPGGATRKKRIKPTL